MKTWLAFLLLGCPIKRLDRWAEGYIVDRVSGRADW